MDPQFKKRILADNGFVCKNGNYKILPHAKSTKFFYSSNFKIIQPVVYASVNIYRNHILEVAYRYHLKKNKVAILNIVSNEFNNDNKNSSQGFKDELIYMRTNLCTSLYGMHLFPISDGEIVYTPIVHVIRNENFAPLAVTNTFPISVLTIGLEKVNLINNEMINIDDYSALKQTIEGVFQTAYNAGNDTLILNDLGCITDNLPTEDIIIILNASICKYGHLFKEIAIAIHVVNKLTHNLHTTLINNIVCPQNFIEEYFENNDKTDDEEEE